MSAASIATGDAPAVSALPQRPNTSSLLASEAARIMLIRLLGAGLGLVAQVVASRLIGAEQYGHYALVFVWLLLLGHLGTAGTSQLLYRLLSEYLETGQTQLAAGLVRISAASTLMVSIGIAVLGWASIQLGILTLENPLVLLAMVTLAAVPLLAFQDFLEAIARGLDRPALGIGPAFLLRHLAIIAGLGACVLLGQTATALTVVLFAIAGLLASIAIQYALLRPHLRAALGSAAPRYRLGNWLRTALPLAAVDLAEVLFQNADVIILGLFVPPEQVAFYFAASRLAQFLAYVPYAVSATTAQKYAALNAAGQRHRLQAMIGRAALLGATASALVAIGLAVFAEPLLSLFGDGFGEARALVPVLCLGIVLACALGPGEDVLNMLGEERLCLLGFAAALLVNVATAFALVPAYGPMGAAIATVTGLGVRGILLSIFAYRRLGLVLPVFGSHLVKPREALS